jgi:hypothetical protein
MANETAASDDHKIRVISVYATKWRFAEEPARQEHLSLGHLEEFYALYKDQLPKVLLHREHGRDSLTFQPTEQEAADPRRRDGFRPQQDEVEIISTASWLFVLPSDQVVAAFDFTLRGRTVADRTGAATVDPLPAIRLLERCAYARLAIDGRPLEQHIAALAQQEGARELRKTAAERIGSPAADPFPPERHQVIFATQIKASPLQSDGTAGERGAAPGPENDADDTIRRILYRVEPPNRPEFVEYKRPSGLNHEGTVCAVTPYVSLLSDHPAYVENTVFLTVVQAVGTAARFRQIWHRAHAEVREFRRVGQDETVGTQSRDKLEYLADELGNLELDLSFSVETSADLGLLIPSLRIESFHRELYAALELRERAQTVSRMFARLDASIRSELTAIEIRERRQEEDKRLRWGLSIGLLTFITIPLGFLGAYFGLNASQVNPSWSIFDLHHYGYAYLAAGVLMIVPLVAWMVLGYAVSLRRAAFRRRQERRMNRGTTTARAARAAQASVPAFPIERALRMVPGPDPDTEMPEGDAAVRSGRTERR